MRFFVSEMNAHYNEVRSLAQYLMEGRDFSLNRTQLKIDGDLRNKTGFTVERSDDWLGELGRVFRSGSNRQFKYFHPNFRTLVDELRKAPIGTLLAGPWIVEALLQVLDGKDLQKMGTSLWVPFSASPDSATRAKFRDAGIPVRANYSAEEVGLIGAECSHCEGRYHVATSNVIVEAAREDEILMDGVRLRKLLVTHLHSYATPFIRYEIGDLGVLEEACACGRDGPTLSHIHGRSKNLLKHGDGRVTPFFVPYSGLSKITAFTDYRIRQTQLDRLSVEIGGKDALTQQEVANVTALVRLHAGDAQNVFSIDLAPVPVIDWGTDAKRDVFKSSFLS